MSFDLLDDIFLLNLALEAPEQVIQGFAFLKLYFSQSINTPNPLYDDKCTSNAEKYCILNPFNSLSQA